jgi:DNA-binding response OmpR family regulator
VSAPAPRVLVVDDEPAIRDLLVRALGMAGYDVVAVADGEAGLVAARNAELPYDLVVTNSYMPSLSGEELIGHLRNLYPGLPILHLQDLAHPIGPNASSVPTLYKPFSIDALLEAVARCLEERIRRAEA